MPSCENDELHGNIWQGINEHPLYSTAEPRGVRCFIILKKQVSIENIDILETECQLELIISLHHPSRAVQWLPNTYSLTARLLEHRAIFQRGLYVQIKRNTATRFSSTRHLRIWSNRCSSAEIRRSRKLKY